MSCVFCNDELIGGSEVPISCANTLCSRYLSLCSDCLHEYREKTWQEREKLQEINQWICTICKQECYDIGDIADHYGELNLHELIDIIN